jgi:hypothetical protein
MSEVQGFLGMVETVRNWIKSFAELCDPLTKLTRVTKMEFEWGEEQRQVMVELKQLVVTCEVIHPIDHASACTIFLVVDTSVITVRYVLVQNDEKEQW